MHVRQRVGAFIGSTFALGPADNDRLSALRVGISIVVPSLVLLWIGRLDLTIYAVFGAFTAMFGRSESHQLRLRHQLQAAAVLVTGASVGMFLSVNHIQPWGVVATEAILAGIGSVVADAAGLKPAGPFFGIHELAQLLPICQLRVFGAGPPARGGTVRGVRLVCAGMCAVSAQLPADRRW